MKKMMAVYDADTRYAERLSDYVNRKEKGVFTAQAFTSKEKLAEYAKSMRSMYCFQGNGQIPGIFPEFLRPRRSICRKKQKNKWTPEKKFISFSPGMILSGK